MCRCRALLIQTIAAGIERTDAADPVISPDPTMNTVDHLYPYQEIDGTRRFLSRLGDANKLVIR